MKKIFLTILIPGIAFSALAQTKKPLPKKTVATTKTAAPVVTLKTALDSTSYAFGTSMGTGLKTTGLTNLNYEVLLKGLKDAFKGEKVILTQQQAQQCINQALEGANKSKFMTQINEGQKFLEENKKRTGIKTTASGLQYEVITEGTGIKPQATDSVLVHYRGTLLNGKQFDSSYDRGEPITFTLNQVIKGWTEGLQLMPAGSKYKLYIPYNLAYGERGAGQDIPPYSALIFDVELLKVNGK